VNARSLVDNFENSDRENSSHRFNKNKDTVLKLLKSNINDETKTIKPNQLLSSMYMNSFVLLVVHIFKFQYTVVNN